MSEQPATCEPPEGFDKFQWHWLRHIDGKNWFAAEMRGGRLYGRLWTGPRGSEVAYEAGWRYYAPVELPIEATADPSALDRLVSAANEAAQEDPTAADAINRGVRIAVAGALNQARVWENANAPYDAVYALRYFADVLSKTMRLARGTAGGTDPNWKAGN